MTVGDRVIWAGRAGVIRALHDEGVSPEDCDRYVPPEHAAVRLDDDGGVAYVPFADLAPEVSP